jgi:transcriptional regulator with XRE-family HTH domain
LALRAVRVDSPPFARDRQRLAKSLTEYRSRENLTQQEFAAKLGVDRKTLNNWERGRTRPIGKFWQETRELLSVERQQRAHARRAGLFDQLERSIRRHYYEDKEDATEMARRHAKAWNAADRGQRTAAFGEEADESEKCDTQPELLP